MAVDEMQDYIAKYPDFPVPAWYAHPVVIKRMIDIIEEGRAVEVDEALAVLKNDLREAFGWKVQKLYLCPF